MADPTLRIWKGDSEAQIDAVNRWMRSQPWWQQIVAQHGGNAEPDELRRQIMRAAQAHGAVIDEGNIEVDPAGNFNPIGHKMRNFLIGAGIAGGGLLGAGALGAGPLSGLFGGSAAGSAGAAGGTAAGLGGGVGIGETAAVTGLAGSGFGAAPALGTIAGAASTPGALSALGAGGKLIPTLISAGTKLGGALLGSHAAGKAAKQQEAAMQQALDLNRGLFERSQANFDPYVNMGPQSMARLGQFLGIQPQQPASVPMSSLVGRR